MRSEYDRALLRPPGAGILPDALAASYAPPCSAGPSHSDLALENLELRHQLHVALRTNPPPTPPALRPDLLSLAPTPVARRMAATRINRSARHGYRLAPQGPAALLGLAVAQPPGPPPASTRGRR